MNNKIKNVNFYLEKIKNDDFIDFFINNSITYNKILLKLPPNKQKKIFSYIIENFKKEKKLTLFFKLISLEILENFKKELLKDNIYKKELLNNFPEIFVNLYKKDYYIEIDYIEDIFNNLFKKIKYINEIEIKTKLFLYFLKITSIEYLKDKIIGYTRINFNQIFQKEIKKEFLEILVDIYVNNNIDIKKEILDYLLLLNNFIYIHEDISIEILKKINKINLEIYSLSSNSQYVNYLYYITIYILGITSFYSLPKLNSTEIKKSEYKKMLDIFFLKNGIVLNEFFKKYEYKNEKYQEYYFYEDFEKIFIQNLFNNNLIFFHNNILIYLNNLLKEMEPFLEKIEKREVINKNIIEEIEKVIPNFYSIFLSFVHNKIYKFINYIKNNINNLINEKNLINNISYLNKNEKIIEEINETINNLLFHYFEIY